MIKCEIDRPEMTKFIKIKNIKFLRRADTKLDVALTATLVLEETIRIPRIFRSPRYETRIVERDVWSKTIIDLVRWRDDGEFVPYDLQQAVSMAVAFGEVEYAS